MYSDISEQSLNMIYDTFSREKQRLLNEIKTGGEEKKNKHFHKEMQVIHSLEINVLKLRVLRKTYEDKIKNL